MLRNWKPKEEWLDESRRDLRWVEVHHALATVDGQQFFGVTGDISLGGMRLALMEAKLEPGNDITLEIAFEDEVVSARGTVQRVESKPWGALAGISFEESMQGYLARRYLRPKRQ